MILILGENMKIFISWSGERSKCVAKALRDWLPMVLQYVEPWMSEADIDAGNRSLNEIAKELADSRLGIICLTPENLNSTWIHYEAGAISKTLDTSKVVPILMDLDLSDIAAPLGQFQAKKLDRPGLRDIIRSIQNESETPIPEERAERLLDRLWPDFEKGLKEIPEGIPDTKKVRSETDVLEDLVSSVRALDSRLQKMEKKMEEIQIGSYLRFDLDLINNISRRSSNKVVDHTSRYISKINDDDSIIDFSHSIIETAKAFQGVDESIYKSSMEAYTSLTEGKPDKYDKIIRLVSQLADLYHRTDTLKELNISESWLQTKTLSLLGYINQYK